MTDDSNILAARVVDREIIQAELQAIYDAHAAITPGLILARASSPDHPLHATFTWDDKVAGEQYRLNQAANLIRSVKIRVVRQRADGTVEDHKIRAWVPASHVGVGADTGSYLPVEDIDDHGRAILLQRMLREVASMRRRYGHLVEFWQELDKISRNDAA